MAANVTIATVARPRQRLPPDRVQCAQRTRPGPRRDPGAGAGRDRGARLPGQPRRAADAHRPVQADRRAHRPGPRTASNGSVLDRFLHGLTEAAAPAGYRIMLYTATDDRTEIATYEDLLASYALDALRPHPYPPRRLPDRLAGRGGRAVHHLRPAVGRHRPPPLGRCRRRGRHRGGHPAPARRRPPADRVPRLAGGIRRRRRPPARLARRDARGRLRRRPASTGTPSTAWPRASGPPATCCAAATRRPRWSAPATSSRLGARRAAASLRRSSASTTRPMAAGRRAVQRPPAPRPRRRPRACGCSPRLLDKRLGARHPARSAATPPDHPRVG